MICPVYTGMSSPHRNYPNMYHFWPILTKKRYPQNMPGQNDTYWFCCGSSRQKNGLLITGIRLRNLVSAPYTRGWAIPGWFCSRCWCIRAPCTRGWTVCVRIVGKESSDLPSTCGDEFAAPWLRKYVGSGVILTKKCYPQNTSQRNNTYWTCRKSKVTGIDNMSTAGISLRNLVSAPCVRGWTVQTSDIKQCFDICPVRTGMNLTWGTWTADEWHLPRVHGDEPVT